MKYKDLSIVLFVFISLMSCNNKPKVITAESSGNTKTESGIFSANPHSADISNNINSIQRDLHSVTVQEILPAANYVYLKVIEGGSNPFWIATAKQDITKGDTYYYKDGLLKTGFESKEHNRTFDTIYLVSKLVDHNHSKRAGMLNSSSAQNEQTNPAKENIPTHTEKVIGHKGSITIAELVNDPKKYEGYTVQITGTCVKINPNIMGRNWIHIQDGSKNDYDLVVTSNTFVSEGSKITIKAQVVLNRDFGAGYSYELILENGIIQ